MRTLAIAIAITAPCLLHADPTETPTQPVLDARLEEGRAILTWTGGRPSYQLQSAPSPDGPWSNEGTTTDALTTTVDPAGPPRFFRVVDDYTARFEVIFDATWSQETHPGAWPPNAHWSGPVGGVHSDRVEFWRPGTPASDGIRFMAERGAQSPLLSEINAAIQQGTALFTLAAGGLGSPDRRVVTFPRPTNREHPRLTLVSMVAPSPDWFIGVAGLSLVGPDGRWLQEQVVPLPGYDAGTDSGADFTSPDLVTSPRAVVTPFSGYPALINGNIVPFGTFTVRRIE